MTETVSNLMEANLLGVFNECDVQRTALTIESTYAHTVLINGRVVLRDRRPAFSDEAAVLAEGRAIARTLLEKTNLTDYPDTPWRTPKPVTDPDRASAPAR